METDLKHLVKCPKCKDGHIIHVGGKYICTDNHICDFVVEGNVYGYNIKKTALINLVKHGYIEPMFKKLYVYSKTETVMGFIILNTENEVDFKYGSEYPICKCPKCGEHNIHMKYSQKYDSFFYGCKDYNDCKFTLPHIYRDKPFTLKNIVKLCSMKPLTRTYKSKKGQLYTVEVFIDKEKFKLDTRF